MQLSPGIVSFVGRLTSEKRIDTQSTLNVENPGAYGDFLEKRYIEDVHGYCKADIPEVLEYKTHNSDGTSNAISLAKFSQPINRFKESAMTQVENKFKYGLVLDEYVLDGSIIVRKKVTAFTDLAEDWKLYTVYRPKQKPDGEFSYSILKKKLIFMYDYSEVCLDIA